MIHAKNEENGNESGWQMIKMHASYYLIRMFYALPKMLLSIESNHETGMWLVNVQKSQIKREQRVLTWPTLSAVCIITFDA